MVFKLAAIIGGVLLMAGVALAGTMTSLDSTNGPTVGTTPPSATSTARQDDRGQENQLRGRQNEVGEDVRGRQNEVGEDVRGPCDEPEHANDLRCTGAAAPGNNNEATDRRGRDDSQRGSAGPVTSSGHGDGHGGGHDDNSGHGNDD